MQMVFTSGPDVCVLLSSWHVHSAAQWTLLCLAVLAMATGREFLIAHRQHRSRARRLAQLDARKARALRTSASKAPAALTQALLQEEAVDGAVDEPRSTEMRTSAAQSVLSSGDVVVSAVDAAYYGVSLLLAYLLMLLVMTYHVGVIAAVVLASGVGHCVVGLAFTAAWRRQRADARVEPGAEDAQQSAVSVGLVPVTGRLFMVDAVQPASDPCCANVDAADEHFSS